MNRQVTMTVPFPYESQSSDAGETSARMFTNNLLRNSRHGGNGIVAVAVIFADVPILTVQ